MLLVGDIFTKKQSIPSGDTREWQVTFVDPYRKRVVARCGDTTIFEDEDNCVLKVSLEDKPRVTQPALRISIPVKTYSAPITVKDIEIPGRI